MVRIEIVRPQPLRDRYQQTVLGNAKPLLRAEICARFLNKLSDAGAV